MNALMAIQIRVQEAQARKALKSVEGDLVRLRAAAAQAGAASAGATAGTSSIAASGAAFTKWGSQVQWAGRQLTYNFTLPLALAGGAATKFALDNERAMVRVRKVYGDSSMSAAVFRNEIEALEGAFRALSDRYGVHQAQVIEIAGDWAAAGASGLALARGVQATMDAMILGEMEAAEATEALIAIQAQYGLNTQELTEVIAGLNQIENETGITMQGLIQGLARSAGVARSAGIDYKHLGAMMAALVPASGSAANAGNALKTIISRLLSPTKEAAEVLGLMGLETQSLGWQSLNGAQRLELLAKEFVNLSDSQKAVVSTVVASRWQINRFDVLMRDITNTNGYYQKALNASASETANFQQKQKELNAVLDSAPHKMQQMWVILQNALADVIQPLIPWIIYAAKEIAKLAQSFSETEPWIQKTVLALLAVLALIGPVGRYIGATAVLFGMLGKGFAWFGKGAGPVIKTLGSLLAMPFNVFATGAGAIVGGLSRVATGAVAATAGLAKFATGAGTVGASVHLIFRAMMNAVKSGFAALRVLFVRGLLLAFASGPVFARVAQQVFIGMLSVFAPLMPAMSRIMSGVQYMFTAGLANMAFAAKLGWIKVTTAWAAGVKFLTAGGTISAFLGRMNFMLYTFFFTTAPAIFSRGWTALGVLTMRATAAITTAVAALQGRLVVIVGTAMTAVMGVMSRAYAAMVALSTRAVGFVALAWSRLPGLMLLGITRGGTAILAWLKSLWPAILAFIKGVGPKLIGFLTGPWGIALTIITTLLGVFWNDIKSFFSGLVSGLARNAEGMADGFRPLGQFFQGLIDGIIGLFNKLPQGVQNAIMSVVNIIKSAALAIYEWFSYINPFAHHSPSLVETVTWGMAEIKRQFASVGNVGAIFGKAASDLAKFKSMAASMNFDEWSDQRGKVADMMPGNLGNFNALVGDLKVLNRLLAEQQVLVNRQQGTVDAWKKRLDAANASLDAQTKIADKAKAALDRLQDAYSAHQEAMQSYANTGVIGMRAMSDEIFANTMEQKRLQLAIMDLEDAGGAVEDIQGKMASLQGDIEKLRGESNDLRAAGAGSDVLGPINAQIDAMQAAYDAMGKGMGQGNGLSDLQKQLQEVERQGQRLDLENALKFDPLTRQIEQAANASRELTFAEIIAGIERERAAMTALQPQIDRAQASYDTQKASVDQLTAARDSLQATYDAEYAQLQTLKDEYQITADAIREIEAALNDVASAASKAQQARDAAAKGGAGGGADKMSPGAQNFLDAAGGNFPEVGGFEKIGREDLGIDQSGLIDDFTKNLQDELAASLASINPLTGLQKMWDKVTNWWNTTIMPAWNGLTGGLGDTFAGIDFSGFTSKLSGLGDWFSGLWEGIKAGAASLWDLLGPGLTRLWENLKAAVGPAFEQIVSKLGPLWETIKQFGGQLGDFFKGLWDVLGPILKVIGGVLGGTLLATISGIIGAIANVIGPIIDWISMLISNIIQLVDGIIQVIGGALRTIGGFFTTIAGLIKGIFTGDFSMFFEGLSTMWQGVKDMFAGVADILGAVWSTIWQTIKGLIDTIVGAVSGFVQGIVDFFTWLWDVLVGHSIVPDMVIAIIDWFKNLWDTVINFVSGLVNGVIDWFKDLYNKVITTVAGWVASVITWFKNLWDGAVAMVTQMVVNVIQWFLDMRNRVYGWIADLVASALAKWNSFKDTVVAVAQLIWQKLVEKFQQIRDNIMEKVNLLKEAATVAFNTLRDNLLGAFNYVKDKIGGIFDGITNFIKTGINTGIRAVNKLIDGLNKVADILPGLDWHISPIPQLAQGGAIPSRRVGGGFETNGARAIVGEGKANHPEFVIPTDPTHRRRASKLYEELGKRLGMGTDDNGLGIGGWEDVKNFIGKGADLAKDGVDWLKDVAQGAASVVFDPVRQIAQNMIDGMSWKFGRNTAQAGLDQVWQWVTGTDEAYRKAATEVGGAGPWRKPAMGYRISSPFGMRTHPITGTRRLHDGIDLAGPMGSNIFAAAGGNVTFHSMNGGLGQYAKVNHGGGLETWYGHLSGYVGGARHVNAGDIIGRMGSTGASTGSHLHFIVKQGGTATNPAPFMAGKGVPLAMGGIVGARRGGTLATIGEGGRDEAVIPLPTGWKQLFNRTTLVSLNDRLDRALARMERMESTQATSTYNDNRTFNFHGDLSFPNVKDGDDAETFIRNLEDLAGK